MKEMYLVDFMTTKCGYLFDDQGYYMKHQSGNSTYDYDSMTIDELIVRKTSSPFYVQEVLTDICIPLVSFGENGLIKGMFPLLISSFIMGEKNNDKIIISNKIPTTEEFQQYQCKHDNISIFKSYLNQVIKSRSSYAYHEYYLSLKDSKNTAQVLTLLKKRS